MRLRLTFFALAIALLLGSGQTARSLPRRTLSLAERVGYQYAIEEVYWRHRIWPKENPGPKPSLDEVMSRADVERKVEDSLRNSQRLADQRRQAITSADLQAEIYRMVSHTKQPDVLRELFAALGNDPFVIAECLARPILAERLVSAPNAVEAFTVANASTAKYELPGISFPLDCVDDTWNPTTPTNSPAGRGYHTAVWTGSEMIVWGGTDGSMALNTGGKYSPSTDSWTSTSTANVDARGYHTAVWTGSEMIVWGGYNSSWAYSNTGARYNPDKDSWTAISNSNTPSARFDHTAVWTGTAMIVWGGTGVGPFPNTGGRYNPSTDSWAPTTITNAPSGRYAHTAVWTGSQMIVWGGFDGSNDVNSGGKYDPITDTWSTVGTTNAPSVRDWHTAIWTGTEMIVWGGEYKGMYFNNGGKYDPNADAWTDTGTVNAPTGRYVHKAVWTGSEMIVWGGIVEGDANTGGRYNIITDTWRSTNIINAPSGRLGFPALWTGSEMIVWGGFGSAALNTGGRYCAQPSAPIVQSAASRKAHGGAGNFDVNLPLSGTPGIECRSGGATNDYTIVVTFLANVSVNGNPQAAVTTGTGTIGSNGMSNGGMVTISGNVVTIPLTNVSNDQTINVTLNSVNGSTNIVVPMSILIGDTSANGTVNAADVAQTKARLGQAVAGTNFRSDVNANGSINAGDVSIVKQNSGTSLPP